MKSRSKVPDREEMDSVIALYSSPGLLLVKYLETSEEKF